MMIASTVLLGVGTFCMANQTAPFISVAFIIGLALTIMGIVELLVMRMSVVNQYETSNEVNAEGWVTLILGVVFLMGQVSEGVAVVSLFALWTMTEGVKAISNSNFALRSNSTTDNILLLMGIVTAIFGTYMFFNSLVFNMPVLLMVGISLFLVAINRFKLALAIEFKAPDFLIGNEEKMAEARRERARAMDKAKEAIRERKAAEEKISKITKAMVGEGHYANEEDRYLDRGEVPARRTAKNR